MTCAGIPCGGTHIKSTADLAGPGDKSRPIEWLTVPVDSLPSPRARRRGVPVVGVEAEGEKREPQGVLQDLVEMKTSS